MELPEAEVLIETQSRRYYRDDAVRWVWILYGLAQAVVTMLLAFEVIHGTVVAAIVTAVALIIYVGVNEILVRPYRSRVITVDKKQSLDDAPPRDLPSQTKQEAPSAPDGGAPPSDGAPS